MLVVQLKLLVLVLVLLLMQFLAIFFHQQQQLHQLEQLRLGLQLGQLELPLQLVVPIMHLLGV